MASLGEAVFDLAANTKPLEQGMKDGEKITKDSTSKMKDDTEKHAGGIGGVFGKIGSVAGGVLKAGLVAGTAAVVGIAGALGGCISAAMGAEQTTAQLEAVLASTGGKAGMTKEAVIGLADSLSQVTMYEDDAIVAGESMLLTFTNIGKDVFPMATQAMLDMSTATGQDLQSSAVQLGKALNDPIAGISALSRVGVTFTEDQKAMITAMVEAGDVAGAQKLILQELQTEFGGSAVAAGSTFAGQLTILKNTLGNVAENIGTAFLPALTGIASTLVTTLNKPEVQAAISGFAKNLVEGLGAIVGWVQANWPTIQSVISTVFQVISTIIGVVVNEVIPFLVAAFQSIYSWVQTNWPAIQAVIETVIGVISSVIQSVMGAVASFWEANGQTILAVAQTIWTYIQTTIANAITIVQGIIKTIMALISGDWEGAWEGIKGIVATVWSQIQTAIGAALDVLKILIPVAWDAVKKATSAIWDAIKGVLSAVWKDIKTRLSDDADKLKTDLSKAWTDIKTGAQTTWDNIKKAITSPIEDALATVRRVVENIQKALGGMKIHIPMPHFSVTSWIDLPAGVRIPSGIGVDWYGSGMLPTIFSSPTLIGVGERGAEMVSVVPLHGGGANGAGAGGRHYNLTYQAVRQESGPLDAARAMRTIGLWAELEG